MIRILAALFRGKKRPEGTSVTFVAPDYSRACVRPRTPGRLRGRGGF
jgi:hypothetical protein